jgi:hypothetical protein
MFELDRFDKIFISIGMFLVQDRDEGVHPLPVLVIAIDGVLLFVCEDLAFDQLFDDVCDFDIGYKRFVIFLEGLTFFPW